MNQSPKLVLPKIKKIQLYRFSLFSLKPNIDIDVNDGIFCLAGANGLGKSTFLAAVNFVITGIVPDPDRKFMSTDEYYRHCIGYSNDFFTGKISEDDREAAAISVDLQLGDRFYRLTRGVFEPQELRELIISECGSDKSILNGEDLTPTQRQQEYEQHITEDIGLASFPQFVFLQHFVLTFDERRQLLLWDKDVLNQALFLGIGADFKRAQKADSLRRERDKAGSLARNYSWQASGLRDEIELLRKAMTATESDADLESTKMKHQSLIDELEHKQEEVNSKKEQLGDAELKRMEASSELTSRQEQYTQEFARQVHKRSRVELHPLIKSSISEVKCALCGSLGAEVVESLQSKIQTNQCPLCNSPIPEKSADIDSIATLKKIDKFITGSKKRLELANKSVERINLELQASEAQLEGMKSLLREYESTNEMFFTQLSGQSDNVNFTIKKKKEEMDQYLKRKYEYYAKRDEKQNELLKLYNELRQKYLVAETDFIPLFKELAFLFLGMNLDIRMEYSTGVTSLGLSFTIEVQGAVRRQLYQLSESQRFFLDIALRMALARYMSDPQGKACLFIDTPEGSLDIAYESRAGQMFAKFTTAGHNIIMTANINTSQILQRMAAICGRSKMVLHRMISWAPLSDVQNAEESLFQEAYAQIEASLDSGGGSG